MTPDPAPIRNDSIRRERSPGFWIAFALGWTAYLGLLAVSGVAEGEEAGLALPGALANVVPAAALSVLVALQSRRLFRPERPILVTLALNAAVALLYALGAAALGTVVIAVTDRWVDWPPQWTDPGPLFVYRLIGGVFLYVLLGAFLMWTESVRRVEESRAVAAREAMLRAQAELQALRAWFNPHFVFNTLHSMLLLVRADPAAAERAIEDVAALIRYADRLRRHDVDLVPLADEVAFCRRYAALEGLRLDDRLRLEWSVAPETEAVAAPAFALQTLLENAVQHAVAPRREGAAVDVHARLDGDDLVLEVVDDGPGVPSDALRPEAGHGLGLLRRRLAALYGPDGRLDLAARPEGGLRATIRIPARPAPARAREAAAVPEVV